MSSGHRDTSRDGFGNKLQTFVLTKFKPVWKVVQSIPPLKRAVNKALINNAINAIPPRPFPISTMYPYTSWESLTNRTWSGRHLPPDPEFNRDGHLPPLNFHDFPTDADLADPAKAREKLGKFFEKNPLAELFRKKNRPAVYSEKSTLLFPYWVQWFTDGFLRTDHAPESSRLKNTSNHHIDLCNVYGLDKKSAWQLRSHQDGKLKSQMLENEAGEKEEYPQFLYDEHSGYQEIKTEFRDVWVPLQRIEEAVPDNLRPKIFAMGVERANVQIGYVMFNVLCLREHNRICGVLKEKYETKWKKEGDLVVAGYEAERKTKLGAEQALFENAQPAWRKSSDGYVDERIFQTARSILMLIIMKIVVEEYINHITPYHFNFCVDPGAFEQQKWYRQNWMTVEFSLVYRWHSALPSDLIYQGQKIPMPATLFNNDMLIKRGLGTLFEEASYQPATSIGLQNTADFLVPIELLSVALGRQAQLKSYNDYREMCRFPRVTEFSQITSDVELQAKLKELYGHVDKIEFYVGLFAEDGRENSALPALIGRLVGIDAFSQAFTNPLLAKNIFNEQTFTAEGLKIISETNTVSDLVHRNVPQKDKKYNVTFYRFKQPRQSRLRAFFAALLEKPLFKLLAWHQLWSMRKRPSERGQHPKHQGCVWATFDVAADLPAEMRVGLFKTPKSFDAVIRFSNGETFDDTARDVHGMAIKLLGVEGEKLLADEKQEPTLDFVLADNNVFFAKNVWHLLKFARSKRAVDRGSMKPEDLLRRFPAVKDFKKLAKSSPLAAEYWSQTPYRCGSKVVRYAVKPAAENASSGAGSTSRDFLREAMVKHLTDNRKPAVFEFFIQIAPDENPKWENDPSLAWNAEISPLIKVATITIPAQVFDTPQQRQFCEALSYTPWRCLAEHQPLGQINRARLQVYRASSKKRHRKLKMPRTEPTLADRPAPWPNLEQSSGCGGSNPGGDGSS